MNKLNKLALYFSSAAVAVSASSVFAQPTGVDNWNSASGLTWKNGAGDLCWRDASWTPATARAECDGALKPAPVAPPPPPPAPAPAAAPAPVAPPVAPVVVAPVTEKVTLAADAFFDFDKAVLKPEGKAKLDELVGKMKDVNLEVVIAVGHTDTVGADVYNQKLSTKRADAVKGYLTGKGVETSRVYTEGKGEKQPVADNKTADGRAKNRRVEVEVVGTRTKK